MFGKCALGLTAAFALLSFAAPAHAAPFDGPWDMVLVTTDGHCGQIKIGMAVADGRIQATSGKFVFRKIKLAGRISGNGQAQINGVAGPREAQGTGRFVGARGQGKWSGTGPSGVCSGYWVANRT